MLFEFYKRMGEECSEYTQSDPAPSELGFQCKHWPLFDNPVLSLMDVQHKTFENRLLAHEWEVAGFVVRDLEEIHPDEISFKTDLSELSQRITDMCNQSHQSSYIVGQIWNFLLVCVYY